jgi:hypothetical protein
MTRKARLHLLTSLDAVIAECRALRVSKTALDSLERARLAVVLETSRDYDLDEDSPPSSPSTFPSAFAGNQPVRNEATRAFRKTRQILKPVFDPEAK